MWSMKMVLDGKGIPYEAKCVLLAVLLAVATHQHSKQEPGLHMCVLE